MGSLYYSLLIIFGRFLFCLFDNLRGCKTSLNLYHLLWSFRTIDGPVPIYSVYVLFTFLLSHLLYFTSVKNNAYFMYCILKFWVTSESRLGPKVIVTDEEQQGHNDMLKIIWSSKGIKNIKINYNRNLHGSPLEKNIFPRVSL